MLASHFPFKKVNIFSLYLLKNIIEVTAYIIFKVQ